MTKTKRDLAVIVNELTQTLTDLADSGRLAATAMHKLGLELALMEQKIRASLTPDQLVRYDKLRARGWYVLAAWDYVTGAGGRR